MSIFTKFFRRSNGPINIVNGEVGLTVSNVKQHIARFEMAIEQEEAKSSEEINQQYLAECKKWLTHYKSILNGPVD